MAEDPTGAATTVDPDASSEWKEVLSNAGLNDVLEDPEFLEVPDEQKASVAKQIVKRNKLFQGDYTRKTQELKEEKESLRAKELELAEAQKIQEALRKDPGLQKLYQDYASGNSSDKQQVRKLDRAIDSETDPARKEVLRELRDYIKEYSPDDSSLKEELKSLREEIKLLKSATSETKVANALSALKELESRVGSDFVNKNREQILEKAKTHLSEKVTIFTIARAVDGDGWDKALLEANNKKDNRTSQKRQGAEPSGTSIVTAPSLKQRDSKGRWDTRKLVKDLVKKANA